MAVGASTQCHDTSCLEEPPSPPLGRDVGRLKMQDVGRLKMKLTNASVRVATENVSAKKRSARARTSTLSTVDEELSSAESTASGSASDVPNYSSDDSAMFSGRDLQPGVMPVTGTQNQGVRVSGAPLPPGDAMPVVTSSVVPLAPGVPPWVPAPPVSPPCLPAAWAGCHDAALSNTAPPCEAAPVRGSAYPKMAPPSGPPASFVPPKAPSAPAPRGWATEPPIAPPQFLPTRGPGRALDGPLSPNAKAVLRAGGALSIPPPSASAPASGCLRPKTAPPQLPPAGLLLSTESPAPAVPARALEPPSAPAKLPARRSCVSITDGSPRLSTARPLNSPPGVVLSTEAPTSGPSSLARVQDPPVSGTTGRSCPVQPRDAPPLHPLPPTNCYGRMHVPSFLTDSLDAPSNLVETAMLELGDMPAKVSTCSCRGEPLTLDRTRPAKVGPRGVVPPNVIHKAC